MINSEYNHCTKNAKGLGEQMRIIYIRIGYIGTTSMIIFIRYYDDYHGISLQ